MAIYLKIFSILLAILSQLVLTTLGFEVMSQWVTLSSLVFLIIVEIITNRDESRKESITQLYNEGADTFRDGLRLGDPNTLSRAVYSLLRVADPKNGADPYLRCSAASAVGLSMEKLSYFRSKKSLIISFENSFISCEISNLSDFIQCESDKRKEEKALYITIPKDEVQFRESGEFHQKAFNLIDDASKEKSYSPLKDITSVMRSYAYYLIACHVLYGDDTLKRAKKVLEKAIATCDNVIHHRLEDLRFMLSSVELMIKHSDERKGSLDGVLEYRLPLLKINNSNQNEITIET